MPLLICDEFVEKCSGDEAAHRIAMPPCLDIDGARLVLGGEVRLQRLAQGLPDTERVPFFCGLGCPSRKMIRAMSLSAWCIFWLLLARDFAAGWPNPKSSCNRKCSQY